jgi:DNA-binding NtrC family response regulator
MIARSAPMRKVVDLARRVAKVDTTVLVTGESGAGKERVARLLHDESPRASAPFLAVNCGAVTTSLLESELFGHAKGSFTGATHDRIGLFEGAAGGTLFLDEIGEIAPEVQVKLLRALQEREVRRVGETKNRKVDVRVIAATNRNLSADVAAGRFREDLYYRLRVIELHVPPLRERKEDVLPLARAMLARTAKRLGRDGLVRFTPHAAERLLAYGWPGNVRELENAVERAVVLVDEDASAVDVDELPEEIAHTAPLPIARPGVALPLEEVERQYVLSVLAQNEGNRARTAEQLGIGPATLYRKLKAWSAERSSS